MGARQGCRAMINVVSVCFLAVLLVLTVGLVAALLELIVRAVLTVGVAFAVALAIAMLTSSEMDSGVGNGTVAFGLALIPTFYLISWRRAAQSARKVRQAGNDLSSCKDFQAVANRDSAFKARKRPKASFADKALSKAWDEAMRLAPCAQLGAAREACAQFMSASASVKVLDVEVIDYTVFIRRQVPGVVRETVELVAVLEPADRERAISNLIGDLVAVGKGARLQLDRLAKPLRDQLAARRLRMGVVTGPVQDILRPEG